MTTLPFGPISVTQYPSTVGPTPYSDPQHSVIFDTGQIGPISSFGISGTTSIVGYNGTSNVMAAVWYDSTNGYLGSTQSGAMGWGQSSPFAWTGTAPSGATRVIFVYATAMNASGPYASTSASGTFNGSVDYTASSYCAYGTRVKGTTPAIISLIPSAITAIVGAVTDGWAWPLASVFAGYTLDVNALCSNLPPIAPDLTPADLIAMAAYPPTPDSAAAIAKGWQWLRAAAWTQYCECTPGSPSPTSPPVTVVINNPGTQPQPIIQCDGSDPCLALSGIQSSLNALAQQMSITQAMVNLIQRQVAPFAYVPGTSHYGLSGQGTIFTADILGVAVQITSAPGYLTSDMEYPQSTYRFGDISFGTADGWLTKAKVTHNPHLFLPISGAITEIGYTFDTGVVANIVELVREP